MYHKVTFRNGFTSALMSLVFVALLGLGVYGQAGTSTITGTIYNEQNEVVAGATVTLVNVSQNTRRTAITSSQGGYNFTSVAPGSYRVEVESAGFKKAITTEFQATVDGTTQLPITLEVGEVSVSVTVDAGSIENIKNVSDGSLGNSFNSGQISQLPIEGRNVANLLSLQPAVTPGGYVAGGRSDQANITLDGVDVNNQQQGTAFEPVLRVTPDSVEEFRVTTANPDASKGRSSGAQISLVTKSGSNQFHGNLFWYHRNDYFNANDWFNNASGRYDASDPDVIAGRLTAGDMRAPRPKLIRNLVGGSFSGPIVKDRLFFFYNYEGMREAKSLPTTQLVPLASMGQGILRIWDTDGHPTNPVNTLRTINTAQINSFIDPYGDPVVDVNPAATAYFAAIAARYPANSRLAGDGINTGGYRFNVSQPVDLNTHTARFDWNVTSDQKHIVGARMNYQQDLFGGGAAFPDTLATDTWSHPTGLALSHTWLINNNLTNKFSYGLTRLAFSDQGDSTQNAITFRDVFSPFNYSRAFSRVNPTQNFANDTTWIKGNHTVQFGTNVRLIRNKRVNWAAAYDSAVTNFGFYDGGGASVTDIVDEYLSTTYGTAVDGGWVRSAQSPLVAMLGRLNQYTANFNYDLGGNLANGQPTLREFATEEYDVYVQDSWKIGQSFTLNLGLRYGYSTPVYETQGYEAAPSIALNEYFDRRKAYAEMGMNYTAPIIVEKSGKVNGKPPMYNKDTNNFQPRVSFAWSPNFDGGIGAFLFGKNRSGVLRGGFAITNDYYGQQLAVSFDAANTLGFLKSFTTPANSFDLTLNPAPAWDGTPMAIRTPVFPGATPMPTITFPQQQDEDLGMRIESSIDRGIQAPVNYTTNLTYGRELPGKLYVEASYIGRKARNLLARRDVMTANNLRDPISGMTWYDAVKIIAQHAYSGGTQTTVPDVAYFNNIWGAYSIGNNIGGSYAGMTNSQVVFRLAGRNATTLLATSTDYTYPQLIFDAYSDQGPLFYQLQYGALDSFGSIANSDYNAGTISIRQRLSNLTWDFNYTFSHSMDDTSGLQTSGSYGSAFILNPLKQRDNYSSSDFDMRHIINFNSLWQIPLGKGRRFFSDSHPFVDSVIGGWQLSSIFRYNSGQPHGTSNKIFDNSGWPTNWNLKSAMVQTRPIVMGINYNGEGGLPTMFSDADQAYQSFRSPYPGESGDRNQLRWPAFWTLDMGLQKSFTMPWYEGHKISFRGEVFNLTNTPVFIGNANTAMGFRPQIGTAPVGYGQFTGTRNDARVFQFALRYDF